MNPACPNCKEEMQGVYFIIWWCGCCGALVTIQDGKVKDQQLPTDGGGKRGDLQTARSAIVNALGLLREEIAAQEVSPPDDRPDPVGVLRVAEDLLTTLYVGGR